MRGAINKAESGLNSGYNNINAANQMGKLEQMGNQIRKSSENVRVDVMSPNMSSIHSNLVNPINQRKDLMSGNLTNYLNPSQQSIQRIPNQIGDQANSYKNFKDNISGLPSETLQNSSSQMNSKFNSFNEGFSNQIYDSKDNFYGSINSSLPNATNPILGNKNLSNTLGQGSTIPGNSFVNNLNYGAQSSGNQSNSLKYNSMNVLSNDKNLGMANLNQGLNSFVPPNMQNQVNSYQNNFQNSNNQILPSFGKNISSNIQSNPNPQMNFPIKVIPSSPDPKSYFKQSIPAMK